MLDHATPQPGPAALDLTWPDGATGTFPYLWLRENCASAWHPVTQERILDMLSIPVDIAPEAVDVSGGKLVIDWPGHRSEFSLDWLRAHRPGHAFDDPAAVPPTPWRRALGAGGVLRVSGPEVMESDAALLDWLRAFRATGVSIVEGLPDDPEAGQQVARRIGFLRETNFGVLFEVQTKPNPNNLAYTSEALPLHTDLPNQELPPGIQFLHCLANEAEGGASVISDGLAMAEDLQAEDPEAFDLLTRVSIPFRFYDGTHDIRRRQFVITLGPEGKFQEICWSSHLRGIFDMSPEVMAPFYRAYRAFLAKTLDPAYRVDLRLSAGEMIVFDNRRVLHGRTAFDPQTGHRHLRGCYVDRGELDSRIRVLARG